MRFFMRYVLLAGLFGLVLNAHAETVSEHACTPIAMKVQNKEIILPNPDAAQGSQLYFFKNISSQSLWLDHTVKHPSVSAGWSSYLHAGNWSALLVNRKNFSISCAVIKPGKVDYLDCTHAVSVCILKHDNNGLSQKKTYWLAEDKSWDDLIKLAEKRGLRIKK